MDLQEKDNLAYLRDELESRLLDWISHDKNPNKLSNNFLISRANWLASQKGYKFYYDEYSIEVFKAKHKDNKVFRNHPTHINTTRPPATNSTSIIENNSPQINSAKPPAENVNKHLLSLLKPSATTTIANNVPHVNRVVDSLSLSVYKNINFPQKESVNNSAILFGLNSITSSENCPPPPGKNTSIYENKAPHVNSVRAHATSPTYIAENCSTCINSAGSLSLNSKSASENCPPPINTSICENKALPVNSAQPPATNPTYTVENCPSQRSPASNPGCISVKSVPSINSACLTATNSISTFENYPPHINNARIPLINPYAPGSTHLFVSNVPLVDSVCSDAINSKPISENIMPRVSKTKSKKKASRKNIAKSPSKDSLSIFVKRDPILKTYPSLKLKRKKKEDIPKSVLVYPNTNNYDSIPPANVLSEKLIGLLKKNESNTDESQTVEKNSDHVNEIPRMESPKNFSKDLESVKAEADLSKNSCNETAKEENIAADYYEAIEFDANKIEECHEDVKEEEEVFVDEIQENLLYERCRFCFDRKGQIDIFDSTCTSILDFVRRSLGLMVHKKDKLPKITCEKCYQKIQAASEFASMAQATDAKYKDLLTTSCEIDKEDAMEVESSSSILELNDDIVDNSPPEMKESTTDVSCTQSSSENFPRCIIMVKRLEEVGNFNSENKKRAVKIEQKLRDRERVKSERELRSNRPEYRLRNKKIVKIVHRLKNKKIVKTEQKSGKTEHRLQNKKIVKTEQKSGKTEHRLQNKKIVKTEQNSVKIEEPVVIPPKKYKCPDCDRVFRVKSTCTLHRRTHYPEKMLPCTDCEKRFVTRGDLEKHKRVHTGEKPYVCDICSQCFTQNVSLRIHKELHRSKKEIK